MGLGEILIAVSMMCQYNGNGMSGTAGPKDRKDCVVNVMTCLASQNVIQSNDGDSMKLKKLINCLGK